MIGNRIRIRPVRIWVACGQWLFSVGGWIRHVQEKEGAMWVVTPPCPSEALRGHHSQDPSIPVILRSVPIGEPKLDLHMMPTH